VVYEIFVISTSMLQKHFHQEMIVLVIQQSYKLMLAFVW